MNLTADAVDAYVEFVWPDAVDRADRVHRVKQRLAEDDTYRHRIHLASDDGRVVAALGAHPWLGELWQATMRASSPAALTRLHNAWLRDLWSLAEPPGRLLCRLDAPSGLGAALTTAGWHLTGERFEYRTPIVDLPPEPSSALQWRTLAEVGLDLAADIFEAAGSGPDWDDDDDAHALIETFLSKSETVTVVEVGHLDSVPVAFIAATVEPATGWSTLSFMGLIPSHRGRGLGRLVHLHGIEVLRQMGGTTYHGGTSAQNLAMLRLFANHRCLDFRHLEEWTLTLRAP